MFIGAEDENQRNLVNFVNHGNLRNPLNLWNPLNLPNPLSLSDLSNQLNYVVSP